MKRLTARAPTLGRADDRWYWALPLLLDRDADAKAADDWLDDPELPSRWPGTAEKINRAENVREAFNSPLRPFVLASTSIGQEGLDFHHYCHAVVRWNLPSNPVDLEQREGRVHRYKGHAVRKNLAARHGPEVLTADPGDVWGALFQAGCAARPEGESDLHPFWITAGPTCIERHVLAPPLSSDEQHLAALKRSLTLYRMVFGQARQEDLVGYLAERVAGEELAAETERLRIDLASGSASPLSEAAAK